MRHRISQVLNGTAHVGLGLVHHVVGQELEQRRLFKA
jgi:hypothetical protein